MLAIIALAMPARAQERDLLELQFGGGYLFRNGDLASLPSVDIGVAVWWSESWGAALRHSTTIGEHKASYDYGDGTRTGARNFHHWAGTVRYRRALGSALELNLGAGLATGAYEHLIWSPDTGPNPQLDPWTPKVSGLVGEVLIGRRITPRFGIRAGLVVYPYLAECTAAVPVAFGVVSF